MPLWTAPSIPAVDRVRAAHRENVGAESAHVASAPATWALIGEHIDHYGGIAIMGLADIRAAAAVSPRSDGLVKVHLEHANGETVKDEISLEQVSALAAQQQPGVDSEGPVSYTHLTLPTKA